MSTEIISPSDAAAAQEYPDRIGFKPDNPFLAAFRPYIPPGASLREMTIIPLIMGTVLGIIFGASSLYLVLKVGLTVSASIPVAVIAITLFRFLSLFGLRDATILENNIVQTAGSAGESIAFGVGVTMPAIMILGFDLGIGRVMLVAVLGALLGILMMIPLRRALIVQQHGLLKYPEGTACAEVLKAGASAESRAAASPSAQREMAALGGATTSARTIFAGFGVGLAYKALNVAFKGWKDVPDRIFGARAVAAGGIISLLRSLPTILSSLREGLKDLRGGAAARSSLRRTDQDLSMTVVLGGSLALVFAIMLAKPLHMNALGASLIVVL